MAARIEPDAEVVVPERIVPGRAPVYLLQKHASRYRFVGEAVAGKSTLDVGCGDGYGTYYLAQHARQAIGIDLSAEAIANAGRRYRRSNLSYLVMNGIRLGFPAGCFEAVCALEIFEHVASADDLLAETYRLLKPQGVFYVSTPNVESYVATGRNPWHVKEYTYREFHTSLARHFSQVEIYGQFCQRPWRRSLYQLSSRLYFGSRLGRYVLASLGDLYVRHIGERQNRRKTDWVESTRPHLFRFSAHQAERADSFLAVCRKVE
jgi:2-polyprenyl-3-methyl-5-hydroxy-6-metoxy-1,4-benzoquinol methylase